MVSQSAPRRAAALVLVLAAAGAYPASAADSPVPFVVELSQAAGGPLEWSVPDEWECSPPKTIAGGGVEIRCAPPKSPGRANVCRDPLARAGVEAALPAVESSIRGVATCRSSHGISSSFPITGGCSVATPQTDPGRWWTIPVVSGACAYGEPGTVISTGVETVCRATPQLAWGAWSARCEYVVES